MLLLRVHMSIRTHQRACANGAAPGCYDGTTTHIAARSYPPPCRSTGLPSLGALSPAMPALNAIPQLTQQLHTMRVARPGLRVYPAKGRAVIFW